VTNRPLPGRRSSPATGTIRRSIRRTAPAVILLCFAAALAATPAVGDPSIAAKQAEAQSVMGQVQQLDSSLERVIQAYDLATIKLNKVRADFEANHAQLQIAKQSLKRAQSTLSARLVSLYTSDGQSDSLEVLLGASSLDDLVSRFNTANQISAQDSHVLNQVTHFDAEVKAREARLKHAKAEAAALVSERASEKASIEGQLAARRALLSSIRGQIAHLQAQEAARQAELRRELQARIAAQQQQAPAQALSSTVAPVGSSNPSGSVSSGPAPPPTHSSVVAIAEQYLGVPYRWGGASPSGFDCSGLVMYVFAQVGVSLPHSSYAQYGMGSPVSRDQLQPGDLVFFDGLGHVGIYVGGGQFIHAPHTGDVVRISSLSGWYASSYVGARRI
jgi:cell wall-associated NlpC family hydrolase